MSSYRERRQQLFEGADAFDARRSQSAATKIDDIIADNKTSLNRTQRMIAESEETGAKSLQELKKQGEQLDRIHAEVHDTNQMLKAANFVLRGMRSIPGAIYNVFATKPKPEPLEPPRRVSVRTVRASEADAKALMATDDQTTRDSSRRAAQSLPAESGMSAGGDGKQTRRVSALDGRPMSKEESELMAKIDQYNEHEEKQLHHISRGLRNLRSMAQDMSVELDAQHTQLEAIDKGMQKADRGLDKNITGLNKLLK